MTSSKERRNLDFGDGKIVYDLILMPPAETGKLLSLGVYLEINDGCSEGNILSIGVGEASRGEGGVEIDLSMRSDGRLVLEVFDYREMARRFDGIPYERGVVSTEVMRRVNCAKSALCMKPQASIDLTDGVAVTQFSDEDRDREERRIERVQE